eukprot:15274212-Alexandrium_andersonii.AAC.1
MPRPRQHPTARHLPAQRRRQVVERRQVHVGLAGEPPTGPDATRVLARHDDVEAAQRGRHGIRGIPGIAPAVRP